jgi:signal transduction histidine kinase
VTAVRRLRLLFLALALVVLGPLALLVHRAIASATLERTLRHRMVAERIFDEMERALSGFVVEEEARPAAQYGYYWAPPDQVGERVAVTRSPLAALPALPFVIGHFQVDADGRLATPLRPDDLERARAAGEWQPSAETLRAIATLEAVVAPYWRRGGVEPPSRSAGSQLPGSTQDVSARADERVERARQVAERAVEQDGRVGSMYDALGALNKGVEQRKERQPKIEMLASRDDAAGPPAAAAPAPEAAARSGDDRAPRENEEARAAAPAAFRAKAAGAVELTPFDGRALDPGHLLLHRTVVRDARMFRQGVLLDVAALERWLRDRALGGDGLARFASLAFAMPFAAGAAPASDGFAYRHRFAEPFDELSAILALRPLPSVSGTRWVYGLSGLVLLATLLGLAALYRMVSVTVEFAERRSAFAAAVSHELKTPLTAIRMYGEMLRDGIVPSDAKRAEYYRHITAESERLSRLINNVLEFAKLEKGERQLTVTVGAAAPVVLQAIEFLRPHAAEAGLTLVADVAPDLPPAQFERDALLQILFNLVDNAIKYARGAVPPQIVLSAARDGAGVRIAVRDHGPGVPASHLGRVFEAFYRGDREITRRTKGTGLGLALVRGLAERMGARVVARNVAEGGFEVAVQLAGASA